MRVAFVSPLPPEPTGIGDYSYELLEELGQLVEVTAVVRDDRVERARTPLDIPVIGINAHDARAFDVSVYQMGNNPKYHRYLFGRALDEPGLLVLHDPSLADFYAELCGGATSIIFRDEVAYDRPDIDRAARLPLIDAGEGRRDLDRLEVLLARRLVSSNIRTLVHSEAIAALMRERYGALDVQRIQLPAQLLDLPRQPRSDPGEVIFGVFGGINYYKRVGAIVDAFVLLHERHRNARMVVAGRADDRFLTTRIRAVAARPELAGALEVLTDLSLDELESQVARCDVAISLRWPTAGEMSATLIRTFGAGRPAIVSDVFQFAELDESFCWRVPIEPELETDALLSLMSELLEDRDRAAKAGGAARRFVEQHATYRLAAESYVEHLEYCAKRTPAARHAHRPLSLHAHPALGVNVLASGGASSSTDWAAAQWAALFESYSIDAPVHLLSQLDLKPGPCEALPSEKPLRPSARTREAFRSRTAARRAPEAVVRASEHVGPYETDLVVVDCGNVAEMTEVIAERSRLGKRILVLPAPHVAAVDARFRDLFDLADGVVAPGDTAGDLYRQISTTPVLVVPPAVQVGDRIATNRPRLPVRFLSLLDGGSGVTRANPFGVVAAFRSAFRPAERGQVALLVIAVCRLADGDVRRRLVRALEDVGGELVEVESDAALETQLAETDVFVSMERFFSLDNVLNRAIARGLTIIAPRYLLDRYELLADERCFVGYEVIEVSTSEWYLDGLDERLVVPGQYWYAPRSDEVASSMRAVLDGRVWASSPIFERSEARSEGSAHTLAELTRFVAPPRVSVSALR